MYRLSESCLRSSGNNYYPLLSYCRFGLLCGYKPDTDRYDLELIYQYSDRAVGRPKDIGSTAICFIG